MSFLHAEFFMWMLPPIFVLFYFWQTQKSPQSALFNDAVLKRLHASEITMGLRSRNSLFLIAALLLIIAMAQPVIFQDEAANGGRGDVVIALDLSKKTVLAFEEEKRSAIDTIRRLQGVNIAVIGYDTQLYRIVPYTTDTRMTAELVGGLDPESMRQFKSDSSLVDKFRSDEGTVIIIGDPVYERNTQLFGIESRIEQIKTAQRLYAHIPLFYYPLGLAMLLIWIALSSMSKRRSVPAATILITLCIGNLPSHGGILDFQQLNHGYEAYEKRDFRQSAHYFESYQKTHDSPEIRYNIANALYKAGAYQEALYWYRKVHTADRLLAQKVAYNLSVCEAKISKKSKRSENRKFNEDKTLSHDSPRLPKKNMNEIKTRLYPM
ncbi:tetratricopeptide repeat protein [Sulfuricurvum sp.]|uniref:tetratricopeptide repeat protein n=1 Tax=Sulfuricurvum sp. TaxID=2025608 RepID=UPI0025E035DB|nr:tetratricopeptide repeat protein [Sulfuricurvum sp.]